MLHALAVIGIFTVLCGGSALNNCTDGSSHIFSCTRNAIFAFDVSFHMHIEGRIEEALNLIEYWVLPQLNIQSAYINVGMATYESEELSLYDLTSNRYSVCSNIDKLRHDTAIEQNATDVMSLTRLIRNLYNNFGFNSTTLVLFTATSDQDDVDTAACQLNNYIMNHLADGFSIFVVNYGNCSFHKWPPNNTAVYNAETFDFEWMSRRIVDSICDIDPYVTTSPPPTPTFQPTSVPGPLIPENYSHCNCEYKTIWLDVFLLIDSSMAMGESGLEEATDFVISAFSKLTIGQASEYNTRLGVIAYASSKKLIKDLNAFTSTNQLFDLEIPFLNEPGTNIEGAINLAIERFQSSYRKNTKRMIILVASAFDSDGWTDPTQAAEIFREDGGVILTVAYDQVHGSVVPMLNTLATPNYNITNINNSSDDLRFLLCEANCFCPKNYLPYNIDRWGAPQGGCYNPVTISAINALARRYCSKHDNSTLSIVENQYKNRWLRTVFSTRTKFWIGLKYNSYGWVWPNGYYADYTNWGPGEPNLEKGECVYMYQFSGFNFAWFVDDCTDDWNYICQAAPCDSTNSCRYI